MASLPAFFYPKMNALDVARRYLDLHVRETGGKNRSTYIDTFNKSVGAPVGSPWCASFVSWCFSQASSDGIKFLKTAGSQTIRRWAQDRERFFTDPDRLIECKGALGGWTQEGGIHGHVFFVARRLTVSSGSVVGVSTIEGNTSSAASRDGDGVYALIRKGVKDGQIFSSKHYLWFVDTTGIIGGSWWS